LKRLIFLKQLSSLKLTQTYCLMDSGGLAFSQAKTSRQVYLWSLVGVLNESYGLSSASQES